MPGSKLRNIAQSGWTRRVTPVAKADIRGIVNYVSERDGFARAEELLHSIREAVASLSLMPMRGHFPPELVKMHVQDYREIHCQIYRIIYLPDESERRIHVLAVLDGRRHLDELLRMRLLR